MKILLPSAPRTDAEVVTWAKRLIERLSVIDLFDLPPGGVILFEGTQPPNGYIEDPTLTSPDPAYIYIRKS